MNKRNKNMIFLFFSTLIMFSLILSACAATNSEDTAVVEEKEEIIVEDQTQDAESSEVTPDREPAVGGTLVIGLLWEPDTLDPHMNHHWEYP